MIQKKSPKGDLENKRWLFFLFGLLLTSGLVYVCLEFVSVREKEPSYVVSNEEAFYVMMEDFSLVEKTAMASPPRSQTDLSLEIVEDGTTISQNSEVFNQESGKNDGESDGTGDGTGESGDDVNEEAMHARFVQNPPTFPGGPDALYKFLSQNLRYPERGVKSKLQGVVMVEFAIERDGTPSHARIVSTSSDIFNEEALRVISIMPKWNPGTHNGRAVRTYITLPIRFQMGNQRR